MKPIHLRLSAFGTFAGTEDVDFDGLAPRGLFLVAGSTGAGKTTIFDAMSWALYGEMPLKESHGVRSDHVDETVRCEVGFTFETGAHRYTVTRNPEQLRPAVRGDRHARETANATLVRHGDGETLPVAEGAKAVSDACQALIGLDATQFQRVILLPQGDFSRFLLASTGERETILGKIFGGEVFDRIVADLKTERDQLEAELGRVEATTRDKLLTARQHLGLGHDALGVERPDDLVDIADDAPDDVAEPEADALEATADRFEIALAARQDAVLGADARRRELDRIHREAVEAATRFDRAATLESALANLDAIEASIHAAASRARRSEAARPIVIAARRLEEAVTAKRSADADLENSETAIRERFLRLGTPLDDGPLTVMRLIADVHRRRQDNTDARRLLEARQTSRDAAAAADEAVRNSQSTIENLTSTRDGAAARHQQIETQLAALHETAIDPAAIQAEVEQNAAAIRLRTELHDLTGTVESAGAAALLARREHTSLLEGFVATQAPRLAATLEDGEPCPVCGAIEHPAPAIGDDDDALDFDRVRAAGDIASEHEARVGELDGRRRDLRTRLGAEADTDPATMRERGDELRRRLQAAESAQREIEQLQTEHRTLTETIADLRDRLTAATTEHRRLEADRATAHAAAGTAAEAAEGLDAEAIRAGDSLLAGLDTMLERHGGFADTAATAATTAQNRREVVDEQLAANGFEAVYDARAACLPEPEEAEALTAAEEHGRSREETRSRLDEVLEQGVPEVRPDIEATAATLEEAEAAHRRLAEQYTTAATHLRTAHAALAQHADLGGDTVELRARTDRARRAHQICHSGGSHARVSLKRWVLARELDRITATGNGHLGAMTGGRYELHRVEEQRDARTRFGLDLEVFDANTGRRRSPRSLSGGEQFQASLALALGLADVIGHGGTASGHRFEALFVDEGFGSLSADALEEAVETLAGLQRSGRMVGAITHVESMKDAIHVGIEVRHRDDGRGSTLVVNR